MKADGTYARLFVLSWLSQESQTQRPPPSRGFGLDLAGLGLGDDGSAPPSGREKTRPPPPVGVVAVGDEEPSEVPNRSDERPLSEVEDGVVCGAAGRGESAIGESGCWDARITGRAGEGDAGSKSAEVTASARPSPST